MSFEKDFDPSVAAQMQAELLRFTGKCHYDEAKKKIVYHSLKSALEAYLTLLKDTVEFDKSMPDRVAEGVVKRGAKSVGILGLAYKGDIKVDILSPSIRIAQRLKELGAEARINDPYYSPAEIQRIAGTGSFRFPEDLGQFDAVLIVADHQQYRFTTHDIILSSLKRCRLVLDNTEIWKDIDFGSRGIEYHVAGDAGWMKA